MENYETLTASGKGTWDKIYEVQLISFTRKYHSYSNEINREIIEYCLRFTDRKTKRSDIRIFTTEEEREAFLNKNFTELQLTPIKTPNPVLSKYHLADLIGKQLSSITFVMDYMQIDFNGPRINIYNWPLIYNGKKVYAQDDIQYYKEFCNFPGKTVRLVDEYLDLGLVIEFEDDCLIDIPLKVGETYPIPEIVEYQGDNHEWIMWQAGDPPFE